MNGEIGKDQLVYTSTVMQLGKEKKTEYAEHE